MVFKNLLVYTTFLFLLAFNSFCFSEELAQYMNMEKFQNELDKTNSVTDFIHGINIAQKKDQGNLKQESNLIVLTTKIISYLLIIGILIGFIVKYLKRNLLLRQGKKNGGRLIQVLESAFIGQGKTVNLVKIFDKILVVGMTQNNMTFLKELNMEDSRKVIDSTLAESGKTMNGFSEMINKFLKEKILFKAAKAEA